MPASSTTSDTYRPIPPGAREKLERLVLADQLAGARNGLSILIPANIVVSLMTYAVMVRHDHAASGAVWLAILTVLNGLRALQYWRSGLSGEFSVEGVRRQLNEATCLVGLSGLVWAAVPFIAAGPLGLETTFHLIIVAGVCGGSAALGFCYAPLVIWFITPLLTAHAISLLRAGTVEHALLAGAMMLYFAVLFRNVTRSQDIFREGTWLKHEATMLASSLQDAHAQTLAVAREMTHRAEHDFLTGLLNRPGFLLELERRKTLPSQEVGSARKVGLALLNLDGFKSINDAFGQAAGDLVLKEVAVRIAAASPEGAAVARLSGDEFAMTYTPGPQGSCPSELAMRLIESIGARFEGFDAGRVGAGIGIYEGPWVEKGELLAFADEALQSAKDAGRNQYHVFDALLRQRRETRRDSERDLPAALESGTIELWYQPILADGGRQVTCVEGLLRWRHPRHGWISPSVIARVAALDGYSARLFGFIVDRACDLALRLRETGHGEVVVAINVSPQEMSQLPVDEILIGRLKERKLPPGAIEIEITEETAIDIDAVQGKLDALSSAGIRIAIDDFGVGYSSLATLRRLHADRIKIDRSFVTGLDTSPENQILLQAMLSLGRSMNLDVVAEGVETPDEVAALRALGCKLMQGYHFAQPMPADTLLASLESGNPRVFSAA